MLIRQLNRMFQGVTKHWRCAQCSYIFTTNREECPYCHGKLVEVEGNCGQKGARRG
jgi:rubrerythrin